EYMSPEQASGDAVDGRSDLYSLGLVAYFGLTGAPAISGDTVHAVLARQFTEQVPPLAGRRPDLPPALAAAVDRLMAKAPGDRFASAEALVEAIDAAQLAAPEVPLPVRMLALDLMQFGLIAVFLGLIAVLIQRNAALRGGGDVDIALPAVFLVAVLWGRLARTSAAARRGIEAGFAPDDVLDGFRRILAERGAERARLRTLPAVRERRRRSVLIFAAMIPTAMVLVLLALQHRVAVAPGQYRVPRAQVFMLFSAAAMLGIACVGLLRSPFRGGFDEWLFRVLWLGWPGRRLLRRAARGVTPAAVGTTLPGTGAVTAPARAAPAPPERAGPSGDDARLAGLESRVAALERWRDGAA
ncbi:MAG: hypothetical protein MUC69_08395, partial [Gemmatimonadales bacterium]|nr:hypothetical protein [Gemmatimonadales bacterium]